ncbi:MAG: hypothetical protein GY809_21905 [Planctomycetes bacterium]|nr:hypothetical protein [Planctomycetota bacterium]
MKSLNRITLFALSCDLLAGCQPRDEQITVETDNGRPLPATSPGWVIWATMPLGIVCLPLKPRARGF